MARPFESFSESRLLTTFLAFSPSSCDFRRGDTLVEPTGVRPTFLPIAALINICLSYGEPESKSSFKNTSARRNWYAGFNLDCLAGIPVGYYYYHRQRAAIYSSPGGLSTISCGNFSCDSYRVGFTRIWPLFAGSGV